MVVLSSRIRQGFEEDYLVIGGSPMLNALAMNMWLTRFPKMRCLLWSGKQESYMPVIVYRESIERMALSDGRPAD